MASDSGPQAPGSKGIMTFHPTAEEFQNFSRYIAYMESQGAHKAGLAKIVPPKDWKPRKSYDDIDDLVIPAPIQQVVTGQSGLFTQYNIQKKPMTVREFRKTANSDKFCSPRYTDFEELERKYWKNVTFNPPIYGADVNGTLYDPDVTDWNIGKLSTILDTVEHESGITIEGVNTPYLYFGMWKTTFAWHTEDMDLYSINYLHFGAPKSWYCVPPEHGKRMERLAQGFFPGSHQNCEAFLRHKMTLISPSILRKYGIPFEKITQEPGEFMVTFPYSYHAGFNHGYNCAESTNFATERWIEYGKRAILCSCRKDMVKISMDLFVKKYQPERYEQWLAGRDTGSIDHSRPTPEAKEFLGEEEGRCSPSHEPCVEELNTEGERKSPTQRIGTKRHRVCLDVPDEVVPKDEEEEYGKKARLGLTTQVTGAEECKDTGNLTDRKAVLFFLITSFHNLKRHTDDAWYDTFHVTSDFTNKMYLDVDRHEPADGYSSSSPLFPQQCLSPVQAEVTLMKQTNVRPSKPTILRPSKLTNLSPSKQTDSSSSKETYSSQSKQTECKSMKSKPHPLLRKLPKQHPLLRPRESSSDDDELYVNMEDEPEETEEWAKPLAKLWQSRPYNPQAEREYNQLMGLQAPYCSICLLFHTYDQVRTPLSCLNYSSAVVHRQRSKPLIPEMCFSTTNDKTNNSSNSGEGQLSTPHLEEDGTSLLVSCSQCCVRVHASCYGVSADQVSDEWMCARCEANALTEDCCLCSLRGGALQRANNDKWVHVLCALAVLEARFVNIAHRNPVDLSYIPLARFQLCFYCKRRVKRDVGCCVQCSHGRCTTAIHPTCAQAAGQLMQPDDWPFIVHVTCYRHKSPVLPERNKAAMRELEVGQNVICKHKNGRYYQCEVLELTIATFYEVVFDDGSYSDNLFPEDIENRDCVKLGPPTVGDVVQVRWTDNLLYGAKFVASHSIPMYQMEFEDGSSLSAKREEVYSLDEELPKRVKSRMSKASDMRFDGIFTEKEVKQGSKRQRVINSRYREDYIEPLIYRAIME
uniref:[histone H3]-trimethyl-L-lysine(9) demethylase n=1 Tax=Oncorhynchus tshawytscha TaxID=74940 RepID=A0A8C8GJQ2_ONCTS